MRKYEQKLHLDKHYRKLQSGSFIHKATSLVLGIIGYTLLYYFIKYAFTHIPDFEPWNNFGMWLNIGGVQFIDSDKVYFIGGLIIACYGSIKLSRITTQNHSVKNKDNSVPSKLLITGDYTKVRHPMYGTFIILQSGFLLSLRSLIGMILALMIIIFQYINAMFEEKKQLIPLFGDEYHQYTKNVSHVLLTKAELIVFILILLFCTVGYIF